MKTDTLIATRDLNHRGRYVKPGDAFECSATDRTYYITRNMAVYATRQMVAQEPQAVPQPVTAMAPQALPVEVAVPVLTQASPHYIALDDGDEADQACDAAPDQEAAPQPADIDEANPVMRSADADAIMPMATRRTYVRRSTR